MNLTEYLLDRENVPEQKEFISGTFEHITYGELKEQVDSVSGWIEEKHGKGNNILLLAENNLFFIVTYLAIIKSENTAVLVETRISKENIDDIIDKCKIPCAFIQSRFLKKLKGFGCTYTEEFLSEIRKYPPHIHNTPDDTTAVIIFTSGSTGRKKGVMLTHRNIICNTKSIIEYLKLTDNDRICIVLPFYYCYGASLLHTHLKVKGSIVLHNSIFLGTVLKTINTFECTGFSGVPSTYQILIQRTPFLLTQFPTLRYFTQAGGKLANKYIRMISEAFFDKEFYIMYGATEATARLSYLPPDLLKTKMGSIGRGIPGVTLDVLTKEERRIKPGEIGEITAIGENIMKGYFNDPGTTADILKKGRLFTGDLATVDEDGFIYVVGRKSNIIKSAGYRISPHEIEETILQIDGIEDCVVVGIPDEIMGEAVTAAVVANRNTNSMREEIIQKCKKELPSYKFPKNIHFFKSFPLNPSNKIDRKTIYDIILEEYADDY